MLVYFRGPEIRRRKPKEVDHTIVDDRNDDALTALLELLIDVAVDLFVARMGRHSGYHLLYLDKIGYVAGSRVDDDDLEVRWARAGFAPRLIRLPDFESWLEDRIFKLSWILGMLWIFRRDCGWSTFV